MDKIVFEPIGFIKSPFKELNEIPSQSVHAKDKRAVIEIKEELKDGLKDLETFSHIMVFFNFNKVTDYELLVKTPWSDEKKGVFATRSPKRPNEIGVSVVKLIKVEGCSVEIEGVDMLDGTPVLDIKPYASNLNPNDANNGWLDE
ncbi:tRNA (N6-threonylcarbamoyladenosine(37)-N6)-methyltransferase TrmO [Clostridium ganghwense]|uniref:tRNA (N6-threonylcarbamoyladenosine(37)-N6)-methyltransferase TrmO n=1 Tax=Clostridium ganghwense TaxID=312089 RepID=A0ABT4CR14_9CLOT|nr:tRNA (N6-threonylcarbamoyladenosine(37)-N6)-methyltransferase TrmO [Clostridium ganghwense]MCY6371487.1 tRNA (N6-threonylcarbamoyladenosine(37)-N6)-methyltransferase TrmO [Clostridium ganghwense]